MSAESVERAVTVEASAWDVWLALTDGEQLSAWFGAEAAIDPRPGGIVTCRWPDGSARAASVEVVEAPHVLVFRWLPFEHDAHGGVRPRAATIVRFVLRPEPAGTRLEIVETRATGTMPAPGPGDRARPPSFPGRRGDLEGVMGR
ncbi:MAG: SRPBCC domain-containing protein [Actinobacteria bacterium]|nr:SRPBCC domain-containing protein [Actinomycetota bacterium]